MELIGKRIKIRELRYTDLEEFYNYQKNEKVALNAGFKPVDSLETAKFKLMGMIYKNDSFAICLNDKLIGTINLYKDGIRKIDSLYTIGISLDELYWHHGYGKEAVKLIVCYAFLSLHASYLEIRHELNNLRSKKMIEALPFSFDAKIMDYATNYKKETYSICLYSVSKEKFMEDIYLWENY